MPEFCVQIEGDMTSIGCGKSITMKTHPTGRRKFNANLAICQEHLVITGRNHFIVMTERCLVGVKSLVSLYLANSRHNRDARHLPGMEMAETANVFAVIEITRFPTAVYIGIGT